MMNNFAPELRKIIAVTLLVAVITGILSFIIAPIAGALNTTSEDLSSKRFEKARLLAIASRPEPELQNNQLLTGLMQAKLNGQNADIAQAELQSIITRIANRSDVVLTSIRLGPIDAHGPYSVPVIEFVGTAKEQDFVRFLDAISTQPKLIRIKELSIRASQVYRQNSKGIDVNIQLAGYWIQPRDLGQDVPK
ncbi:MAG: type II secretion system protein GspM [Pseudomonadota bacterium]